MAVLIHFFGADGVGKTTQARMLVRQLRNKGYDTKLVRIRSGRTVASVLYRFLARLDAKFVKKGEDGRVIRINIIKGSPHKQIWFLIEFLSMIPWIILGIYIPLSMGKTVVAERYVVDAVASIAYLVNEQEWIFQKMDRILLRFIPTNTQFVHLDASYPAIFNRKNGNVDPKDYLEFQRRTYIKFASVLGIATIDTSDLSIDQTHRLVCQSLNLNI